MAAQIRAVGAFVLAQIVQERDRWPLWLPVAMGAGIGIYFALPFEPPLAWVLFGAFWLTMLAFALYRQKSQWQQGRGSLSYYGFLAASLSLVAGLGFGAAKVRTLMVAAPVLTQEIGPTLITGKIQEAARQPSNRGWRIVVRPQKIERLNPNEMPALVRLTIRQKNVEITLGDNISILGVLLPPPGPVAPGAFDYPRQVWFQRVGAVGYAVGAPEIIAQTGTPSFVENLRDGIGRLRLSMATRIRAQLPGETGTIAAALMTGDRQAIGEPTVEALRIAGLAHLLAISGLHMALVGGLIFTLVRFGLAAWEYGALHYPIKKWAVIAGFFGSLAYLLISGASISTQRAFLMISLMFLAVLLDRAALSMRTVATAALIILILTPESLLSVSFQMSFAATAALIGVYEWQRKKRQGGRQGGREGVTPRGDKAGQARWITRKATLYLMGILLTSLVAGLATGPFAAFHFNRIAGYSLIGNILAMPVVGVLIMPFAVLAFFLMPLGLESFALKPMGWGIDWVIGVASRVSALQGAEQFVPAWPMGALSLMTFGGLWLVIWRRPWRIAGGALIALGFIFILTYRVPDVLIDREGKNLAVRNNAGQLVLLSTRRARFAAEAWMRRDGGGENLKAYGNSGGEGTAFFSCDPYGCRTTDPALPKISFVNDPSIFEEECQTADLVIARVPLPKRLNHYCRKKTKVIDRFDLWRNGAYAAWFDDKEIRIEHSAGTRGTRPWVPSR